jgi:putative ABC transport system permease protein
MTVQFVSVGPDFFETVVIPLLRGHGRLMDRSLREAGTTAVISEAVVRRFFGAADPIGRVIQRGGSQHEIVGIVKDTRYRICATSSSSCATSPKTGRRRGESGFRFAATTRVPSRVPFQEWCRVSDPGARMRRLETMEAAMARATREDRLVAAIVGGFSLLAILLTALGLYGVLAYDVGQRTKEIGLRIALGGRRGPIVALILKQGLRLTALGATFGIVAAVLLVRLIEHRLYGISPVDPMMFALTVAALGVVAGAACWLPARRAARLDPMIALRAE